MAVGGDAERFGGAAGFLGEERGERAGLAQAEGEAVAFDDVGAVDVAVEDGERAAVGEPAAAAGVGVGARVGERQRQREVEPRGELAATGSGRTRPVAASTSATALLALRCHTSRRAGISSGMGEPFHAGEIEMQRRAGVRAEARRVGRIIESGLSERFHSFLSRQRLAVAASVDAAGRVYATLLTGPAGFLAPVDGELLRIDTGLALDSPLARDLEARPALGLLAFDPTRRQRLRLNGRGLVGPAGLFLLVDQAYGNCAKYIQLRAPLPDGEECAAGALHLARELSERQSAWIEAADTLFIASFHPVAGADASHRGGLPGFVRALAPDRLRFADYPGNAMFNTLGNLLEHPRVGLLFLDFANGDTLQLAGRAEVRDDLAVEVTIDEVREVPAATSLRFELSEYSPVLPGLSRTPSAGISRSR